MIRDACIAVAALTGPVKTGQTLIPDAGTRPFHESPGWMREADRTRRFIAELPAIHALVPGPMRNVPVALALMRRRADIDTVPCALFILGFGNRPLPVFLPSTSRDRCIDDKPLSRPTSLPLNANDPARCG